jgi:hypothetical protein
LHILLSYYPSTAPHASAIAAKVALLWHEGAARDPTSFSISSAKKFIAALSEMESPAALVLQDDDDDHNNNDNETDAHVVCDRPKPWLDQWLDRNCFLSSASAKHLRTYLQALKHNHVRCVVDADADADADADQMMPTSRGVTWQTNETNASDSAANAHNFFLHACIRGQLTAQHFVVTDKTLDDVTALCSSLTSQKCVIIAGPLHSGKSTIIHVLAAALHDLFLAIENDHPPWDSFPSISGKLATESSSIHFLV